MRLALTIGTMTLKDGNMTKSIMVEYLRHGERGIDVYYRDGFQGQGYVVKNVHPNIVRCAIGEADMEYLLKTRNSEAFCKLTQYELEDFKKHVI